MGHTFLPVHRLGRLASSLHLPLAGLSYYSAMLALRRHILDVGCFLGGDMRRLVFDGAPSANMYGVDIVSHWDVGYALYRDQGRFDAHFIQADILASERVPALQTLKGCVDIISISAVMHQWGWKD